MGDENSNALSVLIKNTIKKERKINKRILFRKLNFLQKTKKMVSEKIEGIHIFLFLNEKYTENSQKV